MTRRSGWGKSPQLGLTMVELCSKYGFQPRKFFLSDHPNAQQIKERPLLIKQTERSSVAVTKPRTRVLYFRVSDEEFRAYLQASDRAGSRSISDFARLAMRRMVAQAAEDPSPPAITYQLECFKAELDRLTERLKELHHLLPNGKDL